jgi:hypothetical protein
MWSFKQRRIGGWPQRQETCEFIYWYNPTHSPLCLPGMGVLGGRSIFQLWKKNGKYKVRLCVFKFEIGWLLSNSHFEFAVLKKERRSYYAPGELSSSVTTTPPDPVCGCIIMEKRHVSLLMMTMEYTTCDEINIV